MYAKTLTVAILAAVASAQLPAIARREFLVEARATQALDDACQTAIANVLPIYSQIPIPPEDLQSATLPSDPCETPSFTGTLAAEYSSYTSEVLDWYTSHSADLLSALASCSELAAYATGVPVCSSYASEALSSASAIVTATYESSAIETAQGSATDAVSSASKTAAASTSASAVVTAGGARETGFAAGIIAAAGFVAAVVAL